jgi:hypothetical protein
MASRGTVSKNLNRQARALEALLTCDSTTEAATACGVPLRTLSRWPAEDQAFQNQYRAARRALVQHGIGQLQKATSDAVQTLRQVMRDTASPASARVAAARTVLELALKAVELEDIEQRLTQLERLLEPPHAS